MTFEALLLDAHLDDVQDAAEAVRLWHAQRILDESAEIEASAPIEADDLDGVLAGFDAHGSASDLHDA
jgi:hypothetical protein